MISVDTEYVYVIPEVDIPDSSEVYSSDFYFLVDLGQNLANNVFNAFDVINFSIDFFGTEISFLQLFLGVGFSVYMIYTITKWLNPL